jgi:hypothetical protein
MKVTFSNILGFIILILALLYVTRLIIRLKLEGFQDGKLTTISEKSPPPSDDITKWCAKNSVLFFISSSTGNNSTDQYICYPTGISKVDPIFSQKLERTMVKVFYPRGFTVSLFSSTDGSGSSSKTLDNSAPPNPELPGFNMQILNAAEFPFSSVKIIDPAAPAAAATAAAPTALVTPTGITDPVTPGALYGLALSCPSGDFPAVRRVRI